MDHLKADKTKILIKLDTTRIADFIDLCGIALSVAVIIDLIVFEFIELAMDFIDESSQNFNLN